MIQDRTVEVSVVLPCLNEARTLAACIESARTAMEAAGISGEVVVADNGSSDGSPATAKALGARVVDVPMRGYGSALQSGIAAARGAFVVVGDADQSYDFAHIPAFVAKLREGYDLVMGNRFRGGIEPRAMKWSHRYIGNPGLSWLGRRLFGAPVGDFHCGLRAFRKGAVVGLGLQTPGMEYASEMVIKATLHRLRITEIPTTLRVDGRDRAPHLRTWPDGWRHLRFMLLFSPRWLFLVPGMLLMLLGAGITGWLDAGPRTVLGVRFDIDTMLLAGVMCLVGHQAVVFALFTKVFAVREGLHPAHPSLERLFSRIRLESGLLVGGTMVLLGLTLLGAAVAHWSSVGLGPLDPVATMRVVIPGVLLAALGVQTIFASFFLSILGMHSSVEAHTPTATAAAPSRPAGEASAQPAATPGEAD